MKKIKYGKYWIGISLGLIGCYITIPFSGNYSLSNLWFIFLIFVMLSEYSIRKSKQNVESNWVYKLIIFLSILMILRILMDPPGLGGAGGLTETTFFVISLFAFFIFRFLIVRVENYTNELRIAIIISIIFLILQMIQSTYSEEGFYKGYYYHIEMWLIASIVLSFFKNKAEYKKKYGLFILFSLIFLFLSILTPHRSRPVFAILNILSILLLYKKFTKIKFIFYPILIIIFTISALGLANVYFPTRSLSAIYSVMGLQKINNKLDTNAALGETDEFRGLLYLIAWTNIEKQPIIGKGYAFGKSEMQEGKLLRGSGNMLGEAYNLSVTGAFHNAVLEIAVFNGLPIAILFLFIIIQQNIKFFIWIRKLPTSELKMFASAIYGFIIQFTGQLLMNGGGNEFIIVLMMLGIMNGLMYKKPIELK